MKIGFVTPSLPEGGTLVVGVQAERALTPAAAEIDGKTGGWLARAMAAAPRFKGAKDEMLGLLAPPGLNLSRIVLAGLGATDKLDGLGLQRLGGVLAAHIEQQGESEAAIWLDGLDGCTVAPALAAAAIGHGARLRSYRFDRYRTREKPESKPALQEITVMTAEPDAAADRFTALESVAQGVFLTRDLVSEPPNVLYPASFAERCRGLAEWGVEVEVLEPDTLRRLGMHALLAVSQGSVHESRVVVLQWRGAPDAAAPAPLAFIGKGVTFDSGGISIKPSQGMEDMKWDMAGAGAVAGLFRALAGRKAKVNAVGILGMVENMPSGSAQRPSDIVTSLSGQTIEVLNTDAEGRLVLADALWYAQDRFKPRLMVDLATLTGAIIVALGQEHAGLFATDDELADRLAAAGKAVGERLWRMPLDDAYDKEIESPIADMKNIAGNRWAGSIIGAQFLRRFTNGVPWAHLDIAGLAWTGKDSPLVPKGGTGYGVRLLERLVAEHYEAA